MKDIYELLHHIDIDENEFTEMEVTELEKARVKQALKKSIRGNVIKRGQRKKAMAASVLIGLSLTTIGLTFPVSADGIPVIGDIFRFFDSERTDLPKNVDTKKNAKNGLYYDYKKYAEGINITKQSNGITFTIRDAVYDGKTLSLTYSIESGQDLGNNPFPSGRLQIQGGKALGSTEGISRVGKHNYVGLLTVSDVDGSIGDNATVKWEVGSIQNPDKQKEIKGQWDFEFSLKATEREETIVNRSITQNDVTVSLEKLSISPMSFVIYYNQEVAENLKNKWDEVRVDLTIKDDLGNLYVGQDNGGRGKNSYNVNWSKTFQKLDPKARKLIVAPHVILWNHTSANYGGVEGIGNVFRKLPIEEKPGKDKEEFALKNIVIDLKK